VHFAFGYVGCVVENVAVPLASSVASSFATSLDSMGWKPCQHTNYSTFVVVDSFYHLHKLVAAAAGVDVAVDVVAIVGIGVVVVVVVVVVDVAAVVVAGVVAHLKKKKQYSLQSCRFRCESFPLVAVADVLFPQVYSKWGCCSRC